MLDNVVLIVASAGILLASIRLWNEEDRKNILYARLHIAGVIDIACIIIMLMMNQPLLALVYLILCPFAAHAIANANYYDKYNKE
ncbi:cation:proton antiporter [Methanotorris igneus]|uniref:Putative monovalent cation/H+ antiporter subunit G n=1 Tax=Methanotorris igneus (strain DSM 5666 / JCM 11834 / Kol 5) TaxID=880724 RepID=F6BB91_METIK|nr:cation:proton antiporter [Methanotorris igneus]AEF95976.1 putative monovalent cation/H+ antiporter subunit G [Methanotorris igneus Kol 5]